MIPKTFTTLDAMIDGVEKTTAATLDATQAVANAVKQAIQEEADPHILAGALMEGIAMTLLAGYPGRQRQRSPTICLSCSTRGWIHSTCSVDAERSRDP